MITYKINANIYNSFRCLSSPTIFLIIMAVFSPSAFLLARQDSSKWSFSKSDRFPSQPPVPYESLYTLPSSFKGRTTSLGFGSKWTAGNKTGSPSPAAYTLPGSFSPLKAARKSFGSPLAKLPSARHTPGVGDYNIGKTFGESSPHYTFRDKGIKTRMHKYASPQLYNPNTRLTEKTTYDNIGFGFGNRNFLTKFNDSPGPAAYTIPSKIVNSKRNQ